MERVRAAADDVRPLDGGLRAVHHLDGYLQASRHLLGERLAVFAIGAVDPDALDRAHRAHRGCMGPRHPLRAQDAQRLRVFAGEVLRRNRGGRRNPHVLDVAVVQDRQRGAGVRAEEVDEATEHPRLACALAGRRGERRAGRRKLTLDRLDVRLDPDGDDAQLLASSLHGGEAVAVLAIVVVDVHVRLRPDGRSARGPLTVHALRHVDRVLDRQDPLLHVVVDEVDRISHLPPPQPRPAHHVRTRRRTESYHRRRAVR